MDGWMVAAAALTLLNLHTAQPRSFLPDELFALLRSLTSVGCWLVGPPKLFALQACAARQTKLVHNCLHSVLTALLASVDCHLAALAEACIHHIRRVCMRGAPASSRRRRPTRTNEASG